MYINCFFFYKIKDIDFCYSPFIRFMQDINSIKFIRNLPIQIDVSSNRYLYIVFKQFNLFTHLKFNPSTVKDKPSYFFLYLYKGK